MTAPAVILHAGALGDAVLAVQLAMRLPQFRDAPAVELVSRADPGPLHDVWRGLTRRPLDGLRTDWLHSDQPAPPEPLRALVAGRCVLNLLDGPESQVARRLALLRPTRLMSVDVRPDPSSGRHIVDQWAMQLSSRGARVETCIYRRRRRAQPAIRPRGPIGIHPGSGGRAKCWPLASFLDVARLLRSHGLDCTFIVGPVEVERWAPDALDALAREFALQHPRDALDLNACLRSLTLLIGNDSGPSHLAALLGTPTLTIFGPTNAAAWRPLGPSASWLQGDSNGAGDWAIPPQRVFEAVRERFDSGERSDHDRTGSSG